MYLISPDKISKQQITQIKKIFEMGLHILHLRTCKKDACYFLEQLPEPYHQKIVIHEHLDLVEKYPLRGIHLKSWQRKNIPYENLLTYCKQMKNKNKSVSSAFHTLQELKSYAEIPFEYVFLSPVFDSISKPNYVGKKMNLNGFQKPFKIVALGGVTLENYQQALKMHFDEVAVLGAIWQTEDPVQSFSQWL